MADLEIPQNDDGYTMTFFLKEAGGSVPSGLGDYTLTLKAWRPGYPSTLIAEVACALEDAATGEVHYTIQAGGFTDMDDLVFRVVLTKAGVERKTNKYSLAITEAG